MKKTISIILAAGMLLSLASCGKSGKDGKKTEITVLAAASLTDVLTDIESRYEAANEDTDLVFSFAGSGTLKTQIEEGAPADIFISASTEHMDALKNEGLMDDASIVDLLENKLVLIVPAGSDLTIDSFDDLADDSVSMAAIGEPSSVPAGAYAEEVFSYLGILDDVRSKLNYGSDVRSVLTWVEEGAVSCGVVYKTDVASSTRVSIVCEAPEGATTPIIYPAGIVNSSDSSEEARAFLEYLTSDEAALIFEEYGFVMVD